MTEEMKNKIERLTEWFNGNEAPPYEIELKITNKCNLDCIFCSGRDEEIDQIELSKKRYLEIIDESAELGIYKIHICGGGEAMMKPKTTIAIMNRIKEHNIYGSLITNGTLFSEDDIKNLVKIGWNEIIFSIDGPDSETNNYLRSCEGAFEKAVNAIRKFNEWKESFSKNIPLITIASVLNNQNYDKLDKMIKLSHNLKVESFCLQLMIDTNSNNHLKLKDYHLISLKKHIMRASKLAKKYNVNSNIMDFLETRLIEKASEKSKIFESDVKKIVDRSLPSVPCFEPWLYIGISVDGKIMTCPDMPEKMRSHNVNNENLKSIWLGDTYNKIRNDLMSGKIYPWCDKCCGNKIFDTREIQNELLKIQNE